jgi:hypothetical protein
MALIKELSHSSGNSASTLPHITTLLIGVYFQRRKLAKTRSDPGVAKRRSDPGVPV